MWKPPPANEYPQRDTWVDDTKRLLNGGRLEQERLSLLEKEIRARCSHTHPDGKSAIETYDERDDHGMIEGNDAVVAEW